MDSSQAQSLQSEYSENQGLGKVNRYRVPNRTGQGICVLMTSLDKGPQL